MMARSNTLSNETLPRRSPLHFGDFTFGWELITNKNESKTKAAGDGREIGRVLSGRAFMLRDSGAFTLRDGASRLLRMRSLTFSAEENS
jgi:hypothetical protein